MYGLRVVLSIETKLYGFRDRTLRNITGIRYIGEVMCFDSDFHNEGRRFSMAEISRFEAKPDVCIAEEIQMED